MTRLFTPGTAPCGAPAKLSRAALDNEAARRRAHLADLEASMIAACETAALGPRHQVTPAHDRKPWDRTTELRYLTAAMRLEATFGPAMRRLRQEIAHLERLMDLPIAA